MRFRKLRIAWSVVCAVACVLLTVLWVRSFRPVFVAIRNSGGRNRFDGLKLDGYPSVVQSDVVLRTRLCVNEPPN
jgi:hypothetical protein